MLAHLSKVSLSYVGFILKQPRLKRCSRQNRVVHTANVALAVHDDAPLKVVEQLGVEMTPPIGLLEVAQHLTVGSTI